MCDKFGPSSGTATTFIVDATPRLMYNLTVDVAHTFFVGEDGWLVHNSGSCPSIIRRPNDYEDILDKHTESGTQFKHAIKPPGYFRPDFSEQEFEELIDVAQAEIDAGGGTFQKNQNTWKVDVQNWFGDVGFDRTDRPTSWFTVILAPDVSIVTMYPIPEK